MESEFPPNSEASKQEADEKDIKQVVQGKATRRKKPLWTKLRETFIGGDTKSANTHALFDILLPAARDMVWETGSEWLRTLVMGEGGRRRGSTPPQSGQFGHVNYRGFSMGQSASMSGPARAMSRAARARHDFDEIVLDSRTDAEEVIDRLIDLVEKYDQASISDLYELVGLASAHTDRRWGWTDLRGAGVSRIASGYLLDLPDPIPIQI